MTLDQLKGYESDVANHRTLPAEVLTKLFSMAHRSLENSDSPVSEAPKRVPRSKQADA